MEQPPRGAQRRSNRGSRDRQTSIAPDDSRTRTRILVSPETLSSSVSAAPRSQSVPISQRQSARQSPTREQNCSSSESADESSEAGGQAAGKEGDEQALDLGDYRNNGRTSAMSTLNDLAILTARAQGSGSSSGSGSTITQASFTQKSERVSIVQSNPADVAKHRPNALSFLDPDSPAITTHSIQRSVTEASRWRRPRAKSSPSGHSSSSSSSTRSSFHSDASSADQGSEPSTSPEQSEDGDSCSPTSRVESSLLDAGQSAGRHESQQSPACRYGTPEMPRGTTSLPHFHPNVLTPRAPDRGHAKHLPRAEKLPLTGYELLASRISSQSPRPSSPALSAFPSSSYSRHRGSISSSSARSNRDDGPVLKPIYRRFEALNHRLLLHLQDELSELEEQLRRLDTADTQTRRLQNRILPASRRAEYLAGGELQWHKTDILGKVGYKLGQYNHVLSTFTETARLPAPSPKDVDAYRTYLATRQPIAEIETRFLDSLDDLIALAGPPRQYREAHYQPQPSEFPHPTTTSIRAEYLQSLDDDPGMQTPVPPPRGSNVPCSRHRQQQDFLQRPASASSSVMASSSPTDSRPLTAQDEAEQRLGQTAASAHPNQATTTMVKSHTDMPHLAVSIAVAVLLPVLMFAVIPGFVGRMAVVLLVALGVFGAQVQVGSVGGVPAGYGEMSRHEARQAQEGGGGSGLGGQEIMLCFGAYGVVMAVVAGLLA